MIEVNIGSPKDIKVTCDKEGYFCVYNKDYCVCNFYTMEKDFILVIDLDKLKWGYIGVQEKISVIDNSPEDLPHTLQNLITAFKRFNIEVEIT